MSWTDERVQKLQDMWAEGHSAAQIAKVLGGVTRNAVIGKVHRLGLSNRTNGTVTAKPGEAEAPAPQETVTPDEPVVETPVEPAVTHAPPPPPVAETPPAPRTPPRDPTRREPAPMTEDRLEVLASLKEIEKTARRIPLMELTERVCKWPIGDPTDPDFHFCGLPATPGKPYCEAHVAVAFQPVSSRRDRERSRSRQ